MPRPVTWQCLVCLGLYSTEKAAAQCEAQPVAPRDFKPGDIVFTKSGYCWYDGDRKWVANAARLDPRKTGHPPKSRDRKCPNGGGNCFGDCCTFQFYYVVTDVDLDPPGRHVQDYAQEHRWRYHVATLALSGKKHNRSGYTFSRDHITPQKVKRVPAYVRRTAIPLLGTKATSLL